MASLIKNQIIKRLSKFVKNLSSSQINLSTFKGEGELSSINLDEKALEDVIELPIWLKIQKATCGRAFIKIPWTHLKTLPIQIQLDDVIIEIETCEKLRDIHNPSNGTDPLMGKYSFTNRVIDGISLTITNLTFEIKAQGFKASVCLPSLDIYSVTPNGKRVDALNLTRLRNTAQDHILLFKEISWANARIEASSNDSKLLGAAIRFIANSCRIRISMKKNLQDSSMVTSRMTIQIDDLLSVVNDAQLKSALNTYQEIMQLIKQASEQKKRNVGEKLTKLERQPQTSTFSPKQPTAGINELSNPTNTLPTEQQFNDAFARLDIIETSLHFNLKRLDLHIIADSGVLPDRLVENGALQLTIANLSLDHYPYHEFGSSKKHWIKYNEIQSLNRDDWADKLHQQWHEQFNIAKASVPNDEMSGKFEKALRTNRIRLFESCSVINIDDLVFYPVSLNNDKHQKRRRPIITSDKSYQVPDSFGLINIQHTDYYYPLPYSFPVPNSDLYIQIMPLAIRVDLATYSWLHAFVSTLSIAIDNSGVLKSNGPSTDLEHVEIKLEAMLPRVFVSSDIFSSIQKLQQVTDDTNLESDISNDQEIEILEITISKILVTNTTTEPTSNRSILEQHLELFKKTNFFQQNQWPFSNATTATRISSLFERHPYDTYLYNNPLSIKTSNLPEPRSARKALHTYYTMTTDSLKKSAKYDIWHFDAKNIYLDFTPSSSDSVPLVKQNMVNTLSLTGWAVLDENEKVPCLNVLGIVEAPSLLKISQKQYTFVMHLVDELGLFLDIIDSNIDQTRLIKQKSSLNNSSDDLKITICLTCPNTFTLAVIDGLENAIINLPTTLSSGFPDAEIESVMHDTNTLIDLVTTTVPTVTSTAKVEPSIPNKNLQIPRQKKSKFEENLQRGLEISSKGSRASSIASSVNLSDTNDDTLSQLDLNVDSDVDLDPSLFTNDFEQQQKATRIELDDDCISLTGKNFIGTTALESVNGVFVKLNQINVCITKDDGKNAKPLYIACNVKYLRIDEFSSMKFNKIQPKLFENESPDEFNNENVPPINIRIDFIKGKPSPPPYVSLQIQDRSLAIASHAIDILTQNLEEILTPEEKIVKQNQPPKMVPIDIYLKNAELTVELLYEYSTTQAVFETKPPMKVKIECLHVLRQIDGQVIIQKSNNTDDKKPIIPSLSELSSNEDLNEKLQQLELFRLENEQLRSELDTHKTALHAVRNERDSLVNTISKLNSELIQAEYQLSSQFQTRNK